MPGAKSLKGLRLISLSGSDVRSREKISGILSIIILMKSYSSGLIDATGTHGMRLGGNSG